MVGTALDALSAASSVVVTFTVLYIHSFQGGIMNMVYNLDSFSSFLTCDFITETCPNHPILSCKPVSQPPFPAYLQPLPFFLHYPSFQSTNTLFIKNFIEVQLTYHVLVSAVQQSDLVIHYLSILFHFLLHFLSQNIKYSFLCCSVGLCCLFILCVIVFICVSKSTYPYFPYSATTV